MSEFIRRSYTSITEIGSKFLLNVVFEVVVIAVLLVPQPLFTVSTLNF
jgi:hypothetical protein